MKVHYPIYAWSLRIVSRQLQHFGIKFINYALDVEDVKRGSRERNGWTGTFTWLLCSFSVLSSSLLVWVALPLLFLLDLWN